MVKTLLRSALREIRQSAGRYLAILAIVGLGVGFFAGLRACQPDMMATGIKYLEEQEFYDFRLLSTLGFTQDDVDAFAARDDVTAARGALYTDFLSEIEEGSQVVIKAHSLTEGVNLPKLAAGRMPQAPDECLGDAKYFLEEALGRVLPVVEEDGEDTRELLHCGGVGLALVQGQGEQGVGPLNFLHKGDGSVLRHGEGFLAGHSALVEGQIHRVVREHFNVPGVQQVVEHPVLLQEGDAGIQGPVIHLLGGESSHQRREGVVYNGKIIRAQRRSVQAFQDHHRVGAGLIGLVSPAGQILSRDQSRQGDAEVLRLHRLVQPDGVLTLEGLGQQGVPVQVRHLGRTEPTGCGIGGNG